MGYRTLAMGEYCAIGDSITGVSCLSTSSGGVVSSRSVLSKLVSEASESLRTAAGGYVGLTTLIETGTALRFWTSSSMGVGEYISGDAMEPASGLA